ncbi:MAG: helicase [Treponemataceae bacterium]|nr:helicase [Treponemataceae bacterium]
MNAPERLSEQTIKCLRKAIAEAGGNEVFACGTINEAGIVVSVDIKARGNSDSVYITKSAKTAAVLIHNHPSGVLYPSDADMVIAGQASENCAGFYIVDNDVEKLNAVVEPILPKTVNLLEPDQVAFYLSSEGPFSRTEEFYEERPSQIELLKDICKVFNQNKIGVFEAGTGVGKSLSYLIPSMIWSESNKERVVISTGTINLQHQLVEKDIPAAESILPFKLKTVLLKGRQNYLCLRRLHSALDEKDLFTEDAEALEAIKAWSDMTSSGSRSDLVVMPPDSVWIRVNSESDSCMGMKCPYRERCFVMKTRKEASDADILIVNHHLLFSDIEMRLAGTGFEDAAVLPPYKRVIFDEAHGIEAAATSFFSESLGRFKFLRQLNMIYRQRKGSAAGLLFTLDALCNADCDITEVIATADNLKATFVLLEEAGLDLIGNDFSFRIDDKTADNSERLFSVFSKLREDIASFVSYVRNMIDSVRDDDADTPVVWECKQIVKRIEAMGSLCKSFLTWSEYPDSVFWLEKRKLSSGGYTVFFVKTPLDISQTMNAGVFEPMESVVCTSATLRTGKSFAYWSSRVGISFAEKERVFQNTFASPFPYKRNLLLSVPVDAPFPSDRSFQPWMEEAVISLIRASEGRALVLFTSYDSLSYACEHARRVLPKEGIPVLKQGDDDRFRLLELFKKDKDSVLFATDSFWEGVDVPGESLSHVIIVKLPFGVPSDPVFAAKSEAIEKRGGNPFMELSVPEAVMHFRQGYGRLMRRSSDQGVVTVLDTRIVKKQYGRIFTESLPESQYCFEPLLSVEKAIRKFLRV